MTAGQFIQGVNLEPGDLDITPSLDLDNLAKLSRALLAIDAMPQHFGHWDIDESGDRKWVRIESTPELVAKWAPDARDLTTLDHLFFTRYGDFDVVPDLAGSFVELMARAAKTKVGGFWIFVASIDDVLDGITKDGKPRRMKDRPRVAQLKALLDRHGKQA